MRASAERNSRSLILSAMDTGVDTMRNHLLPDEKAEFARAVAGALKAAFPQASNGNERIDALMRELAQSAHA